MPPKGRYYARDTKYPTQLAKTNFGNNLSTFDSCAFVCLYVCLFFQLKTNPTHANPNPFRMYPITPSPLPHIAAPLAAK